MRKLGCYLGLATCTLILLLLIWVRGSVKAAADDGTIVGTWIVTVTVNTPPGAPPFVFTDLITFNPGGTFTTGSTAFNAHTSENPFLPTPLVVDTSDGYGVWRPHGDDSSQFALTFRRFLFAGSKTSTALYGSAFPGQNVGANNVEATATFKSGEGGDTLSGPFTTQFVNLSGQVVFPGSGTFTATRLKIAPLATQ
jgi:hypothetical protein